MFRTGAHLHGKFQAGEEGRGSSTRQRLPGNRDHVSVAMWHLSAGLMPRLPWRRRGMLQREPLSPPPAALPVLSGATRSWGQPLGEAQVHRGWSGAAPAPPCTH